VITHDVVVAEPMTLMALLPPAWILHPFLTGFYEHGLQFTCTGSGKQ
jgi:hypothetical protein